MTDQLTSGYRFALGAAIALLFVGVAGCRAQGTPAKPPRVKRFPEAERELVRAQDNWRETNGEEPILMAWITDDEWTMIREFGRITGRSTLAGMFTRHTTTDYCYESACWLVQAENGGRWGKPNLQCSRTELVDCESVRQLSTSKPERPRR